jgi:predicted transcriptional regulator
MTALTLRLGDDLHTKLKLLAVVSHKSVNQIIVDLVAAEVARTLNTNRDHQPGEAAERLRQVMGWAEIPTLTDDEEADLDRRMAQAQTDAERIYGRPAGQRNQGSASAA